MGAGVCAHVSLRDKSIKPDHCLNSRRSAKEVVLPLYCFPCAAMVLVLLVPMGTLARFLPFFGPGLSSPSGSRLCRLFSLNNASSSAIWESRIFFPVETEGWSIYSVSRKSRSQDQIGK